MIFQIYFPNDPLSQFIESFYFYKDHHPNHSYERYLPDGNVTLIIDLTDDPKYIYDDVLLTEKQICRNAWFSGIRNQYITIPSGKESEMFIVNFKKGKAYPFVKAPMDQWTNIVEDASYALSGDILDLRDILRETSEISKKFLLSEAFFLNQFQSKLKENPFVDFTVNRILQSPHQTTIQQISKKVGFSQKHLIKMFKEHVGLTPKAFLKVIRFQKVIREIEQKQPINWTDIALQSGYYDQAHFIQDFKLFSGFTPSQYLQMRGDYQNFVALE
ncbi:MAG: AraC family transcriptional regulator [Saprospiraceae bacterium]|nr:AraC family transcriptional regulator [Saprospiraceae bacterium]